MRWDTTAANDPVFMAKWYAQLPTERPDKPIVGACYRDERGAVWVWEGERWFDTSTFEENPE
jgi:hypothetical protein